MKAKERYLSLASVTFWVGLTAWAGRDRILTGLRGRDPQDFAKAQPFPTPDAEVLRWIDSLPHYDEGQPLHASSEASSVAHPPSCRMETCFDFSRCSGGPPFLHHVYSLDELDSAPMSRAYAKVLNLLRDSPLHSDDPEAACLFVLPLDTLDRDKQGAGYVRNVQGRLSRLRLWNNGTNHVVFNLYSGTYPGYDEDDLGFDPGRAILAKASFSGRRYRPGFDISFPLIHESHPAREGRSGSLASNAFPVRDKHLLAFKGKRYVYGIGSETRNALHHLHDGDEIVLLTTCRHNKDWRDFKDERCDQDNSEYDRWDFESLLHNSTFCLVPRGRRLGSFRLIETLQAGCVPVVLADDWVLPFSELVDWAQVAVVADERLLLQVPEIVRSIPQARIFAMRQKTQVLWENYFSSVDRIVQRTLEIIHGRIDSRLVLHQGSHISTDLSLLAGGLERLQKYPVKDAFTAIVYPGEKTCGVSRVKAILRAIAGTNMVDQIILIRPASEPVSWSEAAPGVPVRVMVPGGSDSSVNATSAAARTLRTFPEVEIRTEGVFTISSADCGTTGASSALPLTSEEVIYAFLVWRDHFSDRIVGYVARTHYWDSSRRSWEFSSRLTNDYSMVLLDAAFYHAGYHSVVARESSARALSLADQIPGCADVLFNFAVARSNHFKTPIALGQRRNVHSSRSSEYGAHLNLRRCFRELSQHLGHVPLAKSEVRLDPALFKDAVSIARKKYKKLESNDRPQGGRRRYGAGGGGGAGGKG